MNNGKPQEDWAQAQPLVNKFVKCISHYNSKSKTQIDAILSEEVKYLEQLRVNEGYALMTVRKAGMLSNGSANYELLFMLKII